MTRDKQNPKAPLEIVEASLPGLGEKIKTEIQKRERLYNQAQGREDSDMLWQHSLQVAHVAQGLAYEEGQEALVPVLVALLHDLGKFVEGQYHNGDVAEEQKAAEWAEVVLASFAMGIKIQEQVVSSVGQLYHSESDSSLSSRIVHDADRLVKMGNWGIAQFFAKAGLRQRDIVKHLYAQGGKELTYARYAPRSMLTSSGAGWANELSGKTEAFLRDLLFELKSWGVADITLYEWELSEKNDFFYKLPKGEWPIFHVSRSQCPLCYNEFDFQFQLKQGIKCQTLMITDVCRRCSYSSGVEYCLPELFPNFLA